MPRPKKPRRLRHDPKVLYYKPRGVPLRLLKEVRLYPDELEAIKLHDLDGLDQTEAAQKMAISQSTFARIINQAYRKLAIALIKGRAIRIKTNKNQSD